MKLCSVNNDVVMVTGQLADKRTHVDSYRTDISDTLFSAAYLNFLT